MIQTHGPCQKVIEYHKNAKLVSRWWKNRFNTEEAAAQ